MMTQIMAAYEIRLPIGPLTNLAITQPLGIAHPPANTSTDQLIIADTIIEGGVGGR